MIQLSKENLASQYFSIKGIDYRITAINVEKNSCQLKNLTTGEFIRMESDNGLGDVKWISFDKINKFRNNK